jgi:hypothetical protein
MWASSRRGEGVLTVGGRIVTQLRIEFAFTLVLESWIDSGSAPMLRQRCAWQASALLAYLAWRRCQARHRLVRPVLVAHTVVDLDGQVRKPGGLPGAAGTRSLPAAAASLTVSTRSPAEPAVRVPAVGSALQGMAGGKLRTLAVLTSYGSQVGSQRGATRGDARPHTATEAAGERHAGPRSATCGGGRSVYGMQEVRSSSLRSST